MREQVFKIILIYCIFSVYLFSSSIILKRNIFTAPPPPPKIETSSILKLPPLPPLESLIEILGIIYFTMSEEDSYAIIRDKKRNKEEIYKVGDFIGQAKILKIEIDRVFFEYDNKNICLNLENKSSETPVVSILKEFSQEKSNKTVPGVSITTYEFQKEALHSPIVNIDFTNIIKNLENDSKRLMEKVELLPNINEGKIEGFRIFNLPEDSIPYQYGLRDGDVIRSVNGIIIDSMATAFRVYNQIKNSNTNIVNIEIIRNGQPIQLTYRLQR